MLKRFRLKLLAGGVFLLLASFGVSLISPAQPAFAAGFSYATNSEVDKNVSIYQHYYWLYQCFKTVDIDKTPTAEVDNWDFFQKGRFEGNNDVTLGYMYDKAIYSCADENVVEHAFKYLGFTNSRDTFCRITGSTYDGNPDNQTCVAGIGDGDWDNNATTAQTAQWLKDTAFSKVPPFRNPEVYIRAMKTLTNAEPGCEVGPVAGSTTLYDSAGAVPGAGADNKYAVPLVVGNSGNFAVKYQLGLGKPGSSSVQLSANNEGGTCNDVVQMARNAAQAYADLLKREGSDGTTQTGETVEEDTVDKSSCEVDGIGWIVCPVITFLSKTNDAAYKFIDGLLKVPVEVFSDPGANSAWGQFRTFANIAFVVVFMVIIYSQITGAGLSNYGIKKLLPKLVITAILVNVSFYICAIAVDVSNIIGSTIYETFNSITLSDPDAEGPTTMEGVWEKAAVGILGATAFIGFLLLIILAPGALLAFALVIFILIARQAFVILLVVISPLAFVAYLLPNTEAWFKKWWKALVAMLMVYPIVGAVFGVSALASSILLSVAQNPEGSGVDDKETLMLMAAAVLAIPLFAVPGLLKGAMAGAGTIGAKLSGMADRAQGRAVNQAGKGLKRHAESLESRAAARGGLIGAVGGYRTRRDFRHKSTEAETARRQDEALTQHVLTNPNRYSDRVVSEKYKEGVKHAADEQRNLSSDDVAHIARTGTTRAGEAVSEVQRAAAIERTMASGGFGQRREILENLGGASEELKQRAIAGAYAKGDGNIYGTDFGDRILNDTIHDAATLQQQAVTNAARGDVTAEHLAENGSATQWLVDTALTNQPNSQARANLGIAAREAVNNEATRRKLNSTHTDVFGRL